MSVDNLVTTRERESTLDGLLQTSGKGEMIDGHLRIVREEVGGSVWGQNLAPTRKWSEL